LALLATTAALVVGSLVVDLMTGPARLSLSEVVSVLFHPDSAVSASRTIVWTFRLPTALLALLIGSSLGIAGAEMQTILNNPLASPYTLGLSAAASFGAATAMVFGAGSTLLSSALLVPGGAFALAMLSSLTISAVGRMKSGSGETILLAGVSLSFLFNAGVAFLQYVASENALQAIVFWIFGSLQGATWPRLAVVLVVLLATLPFLVASAWKLTSLRLGDSYARSLGVDVPRLRLQTMVLVSVLTATAVCFAGAIGFIGLVGPHVARMTVGEDQRFFMPLSALNGALLLSAASIVSKTILPGAILPVGIVTAFIGVPFFAALVLSTRRSYW
jgi:iron complex transport system permease protein